MTTVDAATRDAATAAQPRTTEETATLGQIGEHPGAQTLTGAEIVIRALAEQGVEHIFG